MRRICFFFLLACYDLLKQFYSDHVTYVKGVLGSQLIIIIRLEKSKQE